jgi:hypothetical protein
MFGVIKRFVIRKSKEFIPVIAGPLTIGINFVAAKAVKEKFNLDIAEVISVDSVTSLLTEAWQKLEA